MVGKIIELSACLIESAILSRFAIKYFGLKNNNRHISKFLLLMAVIMISEILTTYTELSEIISIVAYFIPFTIYGFFMLKGKSREHLLISLLSYIMVIAINMLIISFFSAITTEEYAVLVSRSGTILYLLIFITKILLLTVTELTLKVKNHEPIRLKNSESLIILLTFIITASVGLSIREILKQNSYSPTLFVYIASCMVLLNIAIFTFMIKISRQNRIDNEMQILKFQLMQQEKSMLETDCRFEETAKIRHDMKNYVSCALMLAQNKEYSKLVEYLSEFSETKLGTIQHYVTTENRVLNAALNSKLSAAAQEAFDVECVVTGTIGNINEIDVSILISNLLDNAIEACEKNSVPSKIYVAMYNEGTYLLIRIKNTYDVTAHGERLSLKTTKSDKANHGLGLKSVEDIVKKYDGSFKCKRVEDNFIADVMLNCN